MSSILAAPTVFRANGRPLSLYKHQEQAIADRPDGARVRRGIINLNHADLVARRAATLDSERTRMKRDSENRTATRDERE